jgi:predicted RND superfamily exporter protein
MKIMIKPVSLAALTTITGFISFTFTPIIPMREFGFCTSFGVVTVYILAVLFIPSMLLLRKPESYQRTFSQNQRTDKFSNAIAGFFLSIAGKEKFVLLAVVLIVFISIIGLSRIIVDNSVIDFFRNETDMSRSDRFIREHFAGSKDLNLVIQADTTEELLHPDVLSAMDGLSSYLTKHVPLAGKVAGFTDVIKRINQVFNVDQSPEGLMPSAPPETGGFGFNDFGSFGFGNFAFEETDFSHETKLAASDNFYDINRYNIRDMLNFLDIASGISPNMSAVDLTQELKRLTNYDGFAYYEIPSDPQRYGKETKEELQQLVSNYLVLLAGDSNADYSNDPFEPTAIRAMIQLRTTGSNDSQQVIDIIREYADTHFPENVRVIIGGSTMQEMAVTDLILNSQIISISISVIMIIIIIAISNKSLIAGIIGAVPLILAVLCNFTLMGFLGIKLNLGTALIASLTVCIGIDDAIHFLEFFKREHKYTEKDSLRRTFIACGRAIVVTAMSVGSGFAILAFSQFKIIAEFGILTALCMLSTTLVSLTVMPVLFKIIRPKFIYHETKE